MGKEEKKLRREIEDWYQGAIESVPSFKLPELVDQAVAHFAADKTFSRRFVKAMARPMFYAIGAAFVGGKRGNRHVAYGEKGGYLDPDKLDEAHSELPRSVVQRFRYHFEHCGEKMIHILHLRRKDIPQAKDYRSKIITTHMEMVELLDRLMERLPDDKTRVGDVWTLEEIDEVYREVCVELGTPFATV